ncbi:MAG: site-2 protease family protein [Acidothermus cellulolyticus]|nr:site-2 protease family protein [Acidothermus cellulolyticus]
MMVLGIIAFVVALLISVLLHEAGHFAFARLFGMKATQFFVGFGPTLWSRKKGETEYGIKAIPAGGFVKIVGMTPLEHIDPADRPRAFINQPGPQRLVVLVAGSAVHFVIGLVLLFVFALAWPTKPTGYAEVAKVYSCAIPNDAGQCPPGAAPAPAAGRLQVGDVILAVNGRSVKDTPAVLRNPSNPASAHQVTGGADGLVALTRSTHGPITYTVKRGDRVLTLTFQPVIGSDGLPHIGFVPVNDFTHQGPVGALTAAGRMFGTAVVDSFRALGTVPHQLAVLLTNPNAQRSINSGGGQVTSVVGVAQLTGEAFAAEGAGNGIAVLLTVVASVNIFVGIFNLLPLLPLDGGHVAILGYEKARDAIRRLRGRPAGGPVDLTKLMPITYTALALIVGMSLILLYADLVNPVANPFQ